MAEKNMSVAMESVLILRDDRGEIVSIEVNDMQKRAVRTYSAKELGLDDKKSLFEDLISHAPQTVAA